MEVDFDTFLARIGRSRPHPERAAQAAKALIDGALRIRQGGDGLYGVEPSRPVTKPAEAIGAWLSSLETDYRGNPSFHRHAEMKEVLVAASEEVDKAARAMPGADRMRNALFTDAIDVIGGNSPSSRLPWCIAALLGGILVGVLFSRRR